MSDRGRIKPKVDGEVKSVDVDDRSWWESQPMTPQSDELSVDDLAGVVARATDVPVRRQAAALLLLELCGGDLSAVEVSVDVRAVLEPVRVSRG